MNTRKKLDLKKLATAFFLATFVFLTSSTSALAVSQTDNITANLVDKVEDAVFPDSNSPDRANTESSTNDNFISASKREKLLDPAQIPAVKQPVVDRSNPDNKLLEKSVRAFENADELAP